MIDKATATVIIPKDLHHRIIIPKDTWRTLRLEPGDSLQLDITVTQRAEKEKD